MINHNKYFESAAMQAARATCLRANCGTVIVNDLEIIGTGYNSPPLDNESRRTCDLEWDLEKKPKYDLTCCVHAEWRAIIDACKRNSNKIEGSTLYFMRIDEDGNFTDAGEPFCTVCSRLAMESGVDYFALYKDGEAALYPIAEYDQISYEYYTK